MKALFLGTGTSVGIPAIGCDCRVCTSRDPRNRRRRSSLYLEAEGSHVVVDTPPDFREQVIAFGVPRVDAVLFTHSHADHIFGFDDIRRFNTIQDAVIPAYGSTDTLADLQRVFDYVRLEVMPGLYRPRIDFREISGPFEVGKIRVDPLPADHPPKPTLGFLFAAGGRTLGYFPDCLRMADEVVDRLKGIDVMILDALRRRPHRTHMSLEASVEHLHRIGARRSFIIHMCHDLDHEETQQKLPDGIRVSYDGLRVEW